MPPLGRGRAQNIASTRAGPAATPKPGAGDSAVFLLLAQAGLFGCLRLRPRVGFLSDPVAQVAAHYFD